MHKKKKKTTKWAQQTSEFFSCIATSENLCKHFFGNHVFVSFLLRNDRHISKIWRERLWNYIVRPVKDTNINTWQYKSQYVWNKNEWMKGLIHIEYISQRSRYTQEHHEFLRGGMQCNRKKSHYYRQHRIVKTHQLAIYTPATQTKRGIII